MALSVFFKSSVFLRSTLSDLQPRVVVVVVLNGTLASAQCSKIMLFSKNYLQFNEETLSSPQVKHLQLKS